MARNGVKIDDAVRGEFAIQAISPYYGTPSTGVIVEISEGDYFEVMGASRSGAATIDTISLLLMVKFLGWRDVPHAKVEPCGGKIPSIVLCLTW